jgi:hypothetical protein
MEDKASSWARLTLTAATALALGQGFLGLFTSALEDAGSWGDGVGHALGLPLAGAIFVGVMAREVRPAGRRSMWWLASTAILSTVAYIAGYAFVGPPVDFAAAIAVTGMVLGAVEAGELRSRNAEGGPACAATAVGGYLAGGVVGVAVAVVIAPHLPDGVLWYAMLTAILGVVAGAVGGAANGIALGRYWWTPRIRVAAATT